MSGPDIYDKDEGAIVMLAGPIKHWWGENWDTKAHWDYVAWRDTLNEHLVDAGYLVYRPHEAFKGKWTERAQAVNDLVLRMSDVILNMTPPGIPSLGTDSEMKYASARGDALIIPAPPTKNLTVGAERVVQRLEDLEVKKAIVDQEIVIEAHDVGPSRRYMFAATVDHFLGQVVRLHLEAPEYGTEVVDASRVLLPRIVLPDTQDVMRVTTTEQERRIIAFPSLHKVEVLARAA